MFQTNKEEDFLKEHFGKYYSKNFVDLPTIEQREFGYGVFGRKIADRNKSFSSAEEMNSFLRQQRPLFFSYSNAYYKYPDRRPMQNKELIKADIIYEFDADDLVNVEEINGKQWFSEENIDEAKKQTLRLLDFIENDFNFSLGGVSINFSGKAGYHLHLRNKEIQGLSKQARIELVDYLTGSGIFFENMGYLTKQLHCPKAKSMWQKRINGGIVKFFGQDNKIISSLTELPVKKVEDLKKQNVEKRINEGLLPDVGRNTNDEFWKKVLSLVVEKERLPIDRQTSVDLHKIIRVPMTLHGDTGLLASPIPIDALKKFDPFRDTVVFGKEKVKVFVNAAPKFSLNGETFGPFNQTEEELPLYAAIFLIGKGAKLV